LTADKAALQQILCGGEELLAAAGHPDLCQAQSLKRLKQGNVSLGGRFTFFAH
jgi:hypothetical protein